MEDRNGLNDIILNKSSKNNSTKKILLTIATFAIILIVVVVVMNQFGGNKEAQLPHPPEVKKVAVEEVVKEPVYNESTETAAVVSEPEAEVDAAPTQPLEEPKPAAAAKPLDEPVFEEPEIIEEPDYTTSAKAKPAPTPVVKPVAKPAPAPVVKEEKQVLKAKPFRPSGKYDPEAKRVVDTAPAAVSGKYYVQVGSFAKYAPSKSFLDKIAARGYTYTFHKVTRNGNTVNKVLVGPFRTQSAAREALPVIRQHVEPGAFLIKL